MQGLVTNAQKCLLRARVRLARDRGSYKSTAAFSFYQRMVKMVLTSVIALLR